LASFEQSPARRGAAIDKPNAFGWHSLSRQVGLHRENKTAQSQGERATK
jgi:hypothetical protein